MSLLVGLWGLQLDNAESMMKSSGQWGYIAHRPLSSSYWGLPYRILNINHRKELLRGLWVALTGFGI